VLNYLLLNPNNDAFYCSIPDEFTVAFVSAEFTSWSGCCIFCTAEKQRFIQLDDFWRKTLVDLVPSSSILHFYVYLYRDDLIKYSGRICILPFYIYLKQTKSYQINYSYSIIA